MAEAVPRVSVLLPVRDAEASLPDCLDSLRRQSLAELEILAVDDGSRDGSRALLEARARGRSLLTLDTRTGDMAEPLYLSLGFQPAGVIPGYCRDAGSSRMDATTIMWKTLDTPS